MMNRKIFSQILHNTLSLSGLRSISSATASVTKIHRATYNRVYPTLLVSPNGSTVEIRYPEPRSIIKLPVNLHLLSDDEKRERIRKRKPKEKIKIVEENLISYDPSKYVEKIRKK